MMTLCGVNAVPVDRTWDIRGYQDEKMIGLNVVKSEEIRRQNQNTSSHLIHIVGVPVLGDSSAKIGQDNKRRAILGL